MVKFKGRMRYGLMKSIPILTAKQLKNFWAKVDVKGVDACWLWKGSKNRGGYGALTLNNVPYLASRVMLSLEGCKSDSLECCHSCGIRACVNPNHLRFDTRDGNQSDRLDHGTLYQGERVHWSKLTGVEVANIRKEATTESQAFIASKYGVSQSTVSRILTSATWKSIV